MGPGGGRAGLCGQDSVHVCRFPVFAWAIQRYRLDARAHVLIYIAAPMSAPHRQCILQALGRAAESLWAPVIDAGRWTVHPRRHTFVSALPWVAPERWPERRPDPMGRGHLSVRRRYLVYRRAAEVAMAPDKQLGAYMQNQMPPCLRWD